jgi:uncharacterized membrane protein
MTADKGETGGEHGTAAVEPPQPTWFERPNHVRWLVIGLVVVCLALVLADLFYENPHPHFKAETIFGFHAWFGFIAFVVIVFLGRLLRIIVSRPEDYYDH